MKERVHPSYEFRRSTQGEKVVQTRREIFEKYSQPQKLTVGDLISTYRVIEQQEDCYIADIPNERLEGRDRITFSLDGLMLKEESYRRILPSGKPHTFDTLRRIRYAYDEDDYLTQQIDTLVGNLGHIYTFEYTAGDTGPKLLSSITGQQVTRIGLLEVGTLIGDKEVVTFSDLHLV